MRCLPLTADGWACRKSLLLPFGMTTGLDRSLTPRLSELDVGSRNLGGEQFALSRTEGTSTLSYASLGSRQIICYILQADPKCTSLLYELLVVELWLVVASLKNMCFVQFRSRSRSSMQCVMENHKMYKAVLKNYVYVALSRHRKCGQP